MALPEILRETFATPPSDDQFDSLIRQLDDPMMNAISKHAVVARRVRSISERLDAALCVRCGPNRVRLRQLRLPPPAASGATP